MPETLPLLIAVAIGPLIAIVGAVVLFHWRDAHQRRMEVFRTMMRSRRMWLNQEWIGALNLVPVEFSSNAVVLDAHNVLLDKYADPRWKGDEEQRRRIVLDTESAACELLQRIADTVRVELRGPDLRSRLNTPYGWTTDEVQQRVSRDLVMQVLQGRRPIKIEIATPLPTYYDR